MVGVCLIGCGRAGLIHGRNFARGIIEGARLTALADPIPEALENAKKELGDLPAYTDYREALLRPDVDAVIIVSPTKYHCEIVLNAAAAGKHILCEKPMAMNEEECELMIEATKKHNVKLQIGFMRRFDASFVEAKNMLDAGEIGDVVLIKSHTRGPSIPQTWMYDIRKSNGPLAEVNSHDIDTLRWFGQSEFKSVYAISGNYRCPDAKRDFPDFYDNVLMTCSFENGVQGCIDGAQGVGYGYDAQTEIVGTHGVIRVGRTQEQFVTACSSKDGRIKTPHVTSWRKLFIDAYLAEDQHFVDCIEKDKMPSVTGLDGKMAVRVVNAGNLSILEKRIVTL